MIRCRRKRWLCVAAAIFVVITVAIICFNLNQSTTPDDSIERNTFSYWQNKFQIAIKESEEVAFFPPPDFPLIRDPDPKLIPILEKFLQSNDARYRLLALASLLSLDSKARPAAKSVGKCLNDGYYRNRYTAAKILGQIQPYDDDQVIRALRGALKDKDGSVRIEAAYAIWKATESAQEPVETLKSMVLDNTTPENRIWGAAAANYIGLIGPEAGDAIPELLLVLQKNDRLNQYLLVQASIAIGKIGIATEETKNSLKEFLMDSNESLREAAVKSLSALEGN